MADLLPKSFMAKLARADAAIHERALRGEVYALRATVARLEEALAERTERVTALELMLLKARATIGECIRMLDHPEAE